jgi:hypothetical protein
MTSRRAIGVGGGLALCFAGLPGVATAQQALTTFDNGTEGWSISGRETIDPTGGNPGANMHGIMTDVFGADIRNNTNQDFLGDVTRYGEMTISIDVKVNSILFVGNPVPRELIIEFRDFENQNGYPWTSVWHSLTVLDGAGSPWQTYRVTIQDPTATALPSGWSGTGGEDPVTFEPILEPGRTFASVLESVDEIAFTTFVPGFFYGGTDFDIQIDNLRIESTGCYADCDGNTTLDVFDFLCFQDAFVAGAPYADCDGNSAFDVFDFLCFQDAFVTGCP